MALPTYVAAGSMGSGAGAGMSLGLPAGTVDGDYHVLAIGTYNQDIPLYGGKEEGFTAVPGGSVGLGTAGAAGSILLKLYERIRGAGAVNAPVVGDSGTVQFARIFAFRGQALSSYRVVLNTNTQAATTSGSASGGNTSTAENMIAAFIAQAGPDSTGTNLSSPANASLASVTERADQATDDASGGLIGLITGTQNAAGTVDATTYTAGNFAKAHVVLSITSGAAGGGGAGVASKLQQMMCRSMEKVGSLWVPPREIIRPVLVPGFAFSK